MSLVHHSTGGNTAYVAASCVITPIYVTHQGIEPATGVVLEKEAY